MINYHGFLFSFYLQFTKIPEISKNWIKQTYNPNPKNTNNKYLLQKQPAPPVHHQMQCQQQILNSLTEIITNSGHYVTRTGRYQMCLDSSHTQMKYLWIVLKNIQQKINDVPIGICVPTLCGKVEVWGIIDEGLEGIGAGFRVGDILQYNGVNNQSYTITFYITICIITTLILLCLTSTILHCLSKLPSSHPLTHFILQQSLKSFNYKPNKLNIFNGIKTLSMFWIILGHQYFFHLTVVNNMPTFNHVLLSPFMLVIQAGMMAVDGFLFLGGFFVAKTVLRSDISNIRGAVVSIVARILRFWPVYILVLLIFYSILPHTGNGPYWSAITNQTKMCEHWWRSLFFLDNLIDNGRQLCMSWSWYLQLDIQMFIVSLPILILAKKHMKASIMILTLLLLSSLAFTMYMNYSHNFKQAIHLDDFGPDDTSFTDIYIKPWCRCPSYIIGILFAFFYLRYENNSGKQTNQMRNKNQYWESKLGTTQVKSSANVSSKTSALDSNFFRYFIQILGLLIFLFLVFIPRTSQVGNRWSRTTNTLYLTLSKPLYCFSLCLLCTPSLLSYPTLIKTLLDNKFTSTISKLSFVVYLIHLLIIMQFSYNIKTQMYYSHTNLIVLGISHACISCALAFIFVVVVEIPFGSVVRRWIKGFGIDKK